MKAFLSKNYSLTIAIFFVLGLVAPYAQRIPDIVPLFILGMVTLIACFKVTFGDLRHIKYGRFVIFYALRYLLLPPILYFVMAPFNETLATALLILALLPPAVTTPALTGLFYGDVTLAFGIMVIGGLATPWLLPSMVSLVVGKAADVSVVHILYILAIAVVLPGLVFFPLRHNNKIRHWMHENGSFATLLLIGCAVLVGVAETRHLLYTHPKNIIWPLVLSSVAIALFYLYAWWTCAGVAKKDRIAYAACSGAPNVALGIAITLIFFPKEALLLVVSLIPWIAALTPFKRLVAKPTK